jgi:hypothetical protein
MVDSVNFIITIYKSISYFIIIFLLYNSVLSIGDLASQTLISLNNYIIYGINKYQYKDIIKESIVTHSLEREIHVNTTEGIGDSLIDNVADGIIFYMKSIMNNIFMIRFM